MTDWGGIAAGLGALRGGVVTKTPLDFSSFIKTKHLPIAVSENNPCEGNPPCEG